MSKKILFNFLINSGFFYFLWIGSTYAYFDYGTGSLLVQSVIAFFGMIVIYFLRVKASFFSMVRRILKGKIKSEESSTEDDRCLK